jgi:hypothetical protein
VTQPNNINRQSLTEWSDEDLDTMSDITPQDQKRATSLWRTRAPQPFKDLLDAETDLDQE